MSEEIGRKVQFSIKMAGLRKIFVCKELGISRPTLDSIIKGSSSISADKLIKLSELTGYSYGWFFYKEESGFNIFRGGPCDGIGGL